MNTIYTIGYGSVDKGEPPEFAPDEFDYVVRSITPDILIDVRGGRGRTLSGFGCNQVASRHANYEWRGHELGNHGANRVTQAGLDRLVADAQTKRIVLFCACGMPYFKSGTCHRHGMIATQIHDQVPVVHIFKDHGLIKVTSQEIERFVQRGQRGRYKYTDW